MKLSTGIKKSFWGTGLLLAAVLLITVSCSNEDSKEEKEKQYSEITRELISLVETTPELMSNLEKAIAKSIVINPDPVTNPVRNLDDYYDFVEYSTTALPWTVLKLDDPKWSLFDKIDQSLNYFYFVNDIPLEELDGKGLYNNSIQYTEPYRTWLIDYCKTWGEFLSMPASWKREYYENILADPAFGMDKGWYEDPSNWKSFNDFFARRLSSSAARPIASPDDNSVITSAADSEPQGVWEIDANGDIVQKEGVTLKSKTFNSINQLLGPGTAYTDAFNGGTLTHAFLNVNDYHRYHFPLSGKVMEKRIIAADDAVGGIISWSEKSGRYILDCDVPGWQSIETRGCVILQTEEYGLVALMPIGMSQVSSVNFVESFKEGDIVKKGDALGYFLFGGSDFVYLFQQDVHFVPTRKADGSWPHLLMGEEFGRLNK